jgi:asparagine synthase (glutamine-hydrolysing)
MIATLAHRGPHAQSTWFHGSLGLAHAMLRSTPEALNEAQPYCEDGLAITADARIDNRKELIDLLRLEPQESRSVSDSELILHAYRNWGEDCPVRLLGDFAFAIWDTATRKLFCARDPFGVRPFYYHLGPRVFAFASEIKALFAAPGVPRRLDELRVGYHLVPTVEDKEITFFKDIRRLLPGHSLTLSAGGARQRSFWSPDCSRELRLSSDEDYAIAFREIFLDAVRCRVRTVSPIGSALSGGLDSSSVTCAAREILASSAQSALHTFSAVFDRTPQCDERPFIEAVLSQGALQRHFVLADRLNPFLELEESFQIMDEPISSPTLYIYSGLCRAARDQGIRVLLDGFDGDTAVHHGDSYLAELARGGQWENFAAEAKAIARHENLPSIPDLIRRYALPYLTELALSGRWGAFGREAYAFARPFGFDRRRVYWSCGIEPRFIAPARRMWAAWRSRDRTASDVGSLISEDLARRTSLPEHIRELTAKQDVAPRTARQEHFSALNSGLLAYGFETIDKASMALGIESRHPFADRRLIEFCLALPPQQKLHQGWTRMIVRRALSDMLPEEITWRGGKTVNSPAVTAAFRDVQNGLLETVIMNDPGLLDAYVNMSALRKIYQRYLLKPDLRDELLIWQAVTLAVWLRQTGLGG